MEEQHPDRAGESRDTHLLETRRGDPGISQPFLPSLTTASTSAQKLIRASCFTLTRTGGERETKERPYRIQRSRKTVLHQQGSNVMDFRATEGHESMLLLDFQMSQVIV